MHLIFYSAEESLTVAVAHPYMYVSKDTFLGVSVVITLAFNNVTISFVLLQCSTSDFYHACDALLRVEQFVKQEAALIEQLQSTYLKTLLREIGQLLEGVGQWVTGLNVQAAR